MSLHSRKMSFLALEWFKQGEGSLTPQYIRAIPDVQVRDETEVFDMRVREVTDEQQRKELWEAAVKAYPLYKDYQEKTSRVIPVFIAEPI